MVLTAGRDGGEPVPSHGGGAKVPGGAECPRYRTGPTNPQGAAEGGAEAARLPAGGAETRFRHEHVSDFLW